MAFQIKHYILILCFIIVGVVEHILLQTPHGELEWKQTRVSLPIEPAIDGHNLLKWVLQAPSVVLYHESLEHSPDRGFLILR